MLFITEVYAFKYGNFIAACFNGESQTERHFPLQPSHGGLRLASFRCLASRHPEWPAAAASLVERSDCPWSYRSKPARCVPYQITERTRSLKSPSD